jgi:FAD/FMN-containing dehydrogenase
MSNGFSELRIAGRIATPADPAWDEARLPWNLAAQQNPSAIAFVESADDVAEVIRFAGRNDLRVADQGTTSRTCPSRCGTRRC